MATEVAPHRLAPQIVSMLVSLRRRIIAYVWTEGLAVGVAWLGLAFWISLGLDWTMEPPAWFRQGMIALAAVGLVYLLYRFIFRRLWLPIADHNLALILERRFHDFDDSLLTTVELTEQPGHAAAFHPQMLAAAEHAAIRRIGGVRTADVFRRGPLLRSLVAAAAAIVSIAAFAFFLPQAMAVWNARILQSSNVPWPRRVHLAIEGFDNPERRIVVAKGSDVNVVADADTRFEVPESLQIRYRIEEGRNRENMSRVGVAGSAAKFQPYAFTFRGINSPVTFDIFGGDASLRDYHIDVVDVPTIDLVLHCEYPKYTQMGERDLPARSVELPQGSRVTIRAAANKDLLEASIQQVIGDKSAPLDPPKFSDRRHFQTVVDLNETQTLLFTLFDVDHVHNREPIRLSLTARPDEPPRVAVRFRGIGTAVTTNARLPLDGDVTDDYGVAKLWYEYKSAELEDVAPTKVPLATDPRNRTTIHFDRRTDEALDLKDRGLKEGEKLVVAVNALDNCALTKTPNFGPGEKYELTVVSPEQLLSILEARELTLRMRLESIVQDVTTTRDRLARLDFAPPAKKPADTKKPSAAPKAGPPADSKATSAAVRQALDWLAKHQPPENQWNPKYFQAASPSPFALADKGAEPGDAPAARKPAAGSEPGDTADTGPGLSAAPVVVPQALANSEQSASETLSLAASFDDIRDELANNRIDTKELEYRLKDQIGDPLRQIGETMFPELENRLRRLDAVLADPAASKLRRDEAVAQADAILAAMHDVLGKMLELESFNEVVEQLRDIIEAEKTLHQHTLKKQKTSSLR